MAAHDSQDLPRRIADLEGHDAYAVLGVGPQARDEEITAAYRREMARAHPDLGGSADRAQLVNCAFDVLTRYRASYDDLLTERARAEEANGTVISPEVDDLGFWVEPDAEPLDDPPVPPRPRWAARRVLAVLALVATVTVSGLVLRNAQETSGTTGTTVGWTTSEAQSVLPDDSASPGGSVSPSAVQTLTTAPSSLSPSQAATAIVASAAAPAAGGHRCEVRVDGSLWCAGGNVRGQLGIGSTLPAATPVRVESVPGAWSTVAVGRTATCGLQRDGSLWCWGDNTFGQMGDGTNSFRDRPVPIQPPGHFLAVDLDAHVCAVRADHTLWCWGAGKQGQLGDGGGADRASPVQVGREATWAAVTVGAGWTCGVRQDGSQLCWGAARR